MEGKRHVGIGQRAEQLGQERFLPHAEERSLEFRTAQKAEPFELGEKVLPGPHPRRSPEDVNRWVG